MTDKRDEMFQETMDKLDKTIETLDRIEAMLKQLESRVGKLPQEKREDEQHE